MQRDAKTPKPAADAGLERRGARGGPLSFPCGKRQVALAFRAVALAVAGALLTLVEGSRPRQSYADDVIQRVASDFGWGRRIRAVLWLESVQPHTPMA